jgi:hypothetical protein
MEGRRRESASDDIAVHVDENLREAFCHPPLVPPPGAWYQQFRRRGLVAWLQEIDPGPRFEPSSGGSSADDLVYILGQIALVVQGRAASHRPWNIPSHPTGSQNGGCVSDV